MRGKMEQNELRQKAKLLPVTCWIGKNGLTEAALGEIKKMLKKRKLVKVRLLKNFAEGRDEKAVAGEIAARTSSVVIQAIGSVVVLYKR